MNITTQFFLNLFDEFKKVQREKITAYISIASTRVPQSVWQGNTEYATALLTAHMLTASGAQGSGSTAGALTQESVGDLSRSFQACFEPTSGDALLRTTRYGVDFVQLRRETVVSCMTTASGVIPRTCW